MTAARDETFALWARSNPEMAQWLDDKAAAGNTFAASVRGGICRFGQPTPKQAAAVLRAMGEDRQRAAGALPAAQQVATADTIRAALARAAESGLKRPRLRCGAVHFDWAGEKSRNPGCIYVVLSAAELYLGKITPAGELLPSREARQEHIDTVMQIAADPLTAAVEHGRLTGACACCGRPLSDAESVARGIGPVCARRFFGA